MSSVKGAQQKAVVDKLLTEVSNAYLPKTFICEQVLTPLPVVQKTGILPAYGNAHLRIVNTLVGGRARPRFASTIERDVSRLYRIESHSIQDLVTEDDYDNVEAPFDAEKDTTMGLTNIILTEKEFSLASAMRDTSVIEQNIVLAGNDQFSDFENSDPVGVIAGARATGHRESGQRLNAAILPYQVYEVMRYHPQVLENLGFKDNRAGTLSFDDIKRFLNVDILHVPDALYNKAKEGQADDLEQIWGNDIILYHVEPRAAKYQQTLGYYVSQKNRGSRRVKKYEVEDLFNTNGVVVDDTYSFEIVKPESAFLIKDAINEGFGLD